MKKYLLILAIVTSIATSQAQSLAIGAKVPDMKGIEWVTAAPQGTKTLYVDFYQASNANCQKNLERIKELRKEYSQLKVVILTRQNDETTKKMAQELGAGFSVGYDATGEVYKAFGVRFVPFSMIFDGKGALLWQGNAAQLDAEVLKGL